SSRDLRLHRPNVGRKSFAIKCRRRGDILPISKRSLSDIVPMEFCKSGRRRPD
ncbi:hypothetical protein M9458_051845, partial [Cirrhinus mrigala]